MSEESIDLSTGGIRSLIIIIILPKVNIVPRPFEFHKRKTQRISLCSELITSLLGRAIDKISMGTTLISVLKNLAGEIL